MKRTFRDQIAAIIKKRGNAASDSDLDRATTPAAETLITYIRQWKFGSRNVALGRLIECRRWTEQGTLVLERDFKGNAYPFKLPLEEAYERYMYGDQWTQYFPMYSFPDGLKHVPATITPDWETELKGLFFDLGRIPLAGAKAISLGKNVKGYGVNNPYCFATWDRQISEWKAAQEAIDAFVTARGEGWLHLTSTALQDPERGKAFAKEIGDILAKAGDLVEPSYAAIKEGDRKLYIRQDASRARSELKAVAKFLTKYGVKTEPPEIAALIKIVNDLESVALQPKQS